MQSKLIKEMLKIKPNQFIVKLLKSPPLLEITFMNFPALQYTFYARQLYRQVLLRARISYGISVRPSVCLSVCHNPVVYQAQVR